MDPMAGENFVTQTQFANTMSLLQEIRTDIKGDVADLHTAVVEMKREITGRQDIANNRTSKNETAVAEAKIEVAEVKRIVTHIDKHGCSNLVPHKSTLTALETAGVVPVDGGRWKVPTPKQMGIGAGLTAFGVALLKLIELAQQWWAHLQQAAK
jgi:hypothetical protein